MCKGATLFSFRTLIPPIIPVTFRLSSNTYFSGDHFPEQIKFRLFQ